MANPFTDYAGGIGESITGMFSSAGGVLLKVIGGVIFIGIVIAVLMWRKRKKSMNIPVTIWIPRSDGKITDEINAVGGYYRLKQREGGYITVFRLKRKGLASLELPPPSSRFLVGLSRKLYLVQKGPDDFEAVLPESFRYVTTASGKKIAMIDLKCINQDATAWVEDIRENSIKRFTLSGFWDKYKDFIQITIFIFIVMISMYVNWKGLKDVAAALQNVASSLSPSAPVVT
ncbi:MAG: hypothetical protein EHM47_00900 [Ignavibacteriales bacterium]|nr:MAG: hypothetical protein EHM47_00900 [Ignavibacteriales bacterium]